MHALVATIVHHPEDARILHRQIRALVDAGHTVTYVAPFRECGVIPWDQVRAVDVPRASGRDRMSAIQAARAVLAKLAPQADLLLFHDPELLLALPARRPVTVWDVHEDTPAALLTKPWIPQPLRRPIGSVVRGFERRASGSQGAALLRGLHNDDGKRQRRNDSVPVGEPMPMSRCPRRDFGNERAFVGDDFIEGEDVRVAPHPLGLDLVAGREVHAAQPARHRARLLDAPGPEEPIAVRPGHREPDLGALPAGVRRGRHQRDREDRSDGQTGGHPLHSCNGRAVYVVSVTLASPRGWSGSPPWASTCLATRE